MPVARTFACAATVRGYVYVFGGSRDGNGIDPYSGIMQRYWPSTDQWTTVTASRNPRLGASAVEYNDGVIFVLGGWNGRDVDVNEYYDVPSNSWIARTPLPKPKSGFVAALVGSLIYILGGGSNSAPADSRLRRLTPFSMAADPVYVYDIFRNSWGTAPGYPFPMSCSNCAVIGDLIYIIGPYITNLNPAPAALTFNVKTGEWRDIPGPPSYVWPSVVAINGRLYAFGGCRNLNVAEGRIREYVPQSNTWRTLPPTLSLARSFAAAAVANNTAYVMGGNPNWDANSAVALSEKLDPASLNVWLYRKS
jgi:N-acetylneuraminic acid mutarotase